MAAVLEPSNNIRKADLESTRLAFFISPPSLKICNKNKEVTNNEKEVDSRRVSDEKKEYHFSSFL